MATVHKLIAEHRLVRITVPLGVGELPFRVVYGFPEVKLWMERDVPNMKTGHLRAAQTPNEQLDDVLYRWTSGQPFKYSKWFKDLMPREDEVWEMKTADLRIFGWIYRPRVFIAVFGDYADLYKGNPPRKSYEDAKNCVLQERDAIDLDEPKFATGKFDELV